MSSRAWSSPDPGAEVVQPRPAAVLAAAASVPLGAAVLVAAGLLPWGARVVVGLAVVVLGQRIRSLPGTVLGARVGAPTARGVGLAVIVGGGLLAAGALAVGLDGGSIAPDLGDVDADASSGVFSLGLSALPSSLLGVQVAGAGAALAWWAEGDQRARAVGETLLGTGAAVLVVGLTADGALGLGGSLRAIVLAVVAAAAAAAWVRSTAGAPWWRAAGIGAGVLLALQFAEAGGVVEAVSGGIISRSVQDGSEGAGALALAVGLGTASALVVVAVLRRDALVGALPVGVLLLSRPVDHGIGQVGAIVVPALLVLGATATMAGVGPLARRLDREARVVVLGIAVVVLVVVLDQALADASGSGGTDTGRSISAVLAALALLGTTAAAHVLPARAGQTLALATVLLVIAADPLSGLSDVDPGSTLSKDGVVAGLLVLELLVGASVLRRHRPPLVVAAVGLLVAVVVGRLATTLLIGRSDLDSAGFAAAVLGLPLVALIAAATVALAGPTRTVRGAQALAGGLGLGSAVSTTSIVLLLGSDAGRDGRLPAVEGLQAVVSVLLVLLLALGLALLAASTARRASPAVALAVAFGVGALGVFLAAVAGTLVSSTAEALPAAAGVLGSAFGYDAIGSRAGAASGVWPVLFALLGAALLGAAWWLESRRPLPADAPLG
jgi:hypothetical protein